MSESLASLLELNNLINCENFEGNKDEIIKSIEALKLTNPNLDLKISLRKNQNEEKLFCQGFCLGNTQKKYYLKDLIYFDNHECHACCLTCNFKWIFNKVYENPNKLIPCLRCSLDNSFQNYFYSEEFITSSVIPAYILNEIKRNFIDPEIYASCYVCGALIKKDESLSLDCGHFFCVNDWQGLVESIIKEYQQIIMNGSFEGDFKFQFICRCGSKHPCKDFSNVLRFCTRIKDLNFYTKFVFEHGDFFNLGAALHKCSKCKRVAQADEDGNYCPDCLCCYKGNHPMHSGMECEELLKHKDQYEIDFTHPHFKIEEVEAKNSVVMRLIKGCENIKTVYYIKNDYKNIIFEFKKVSRKCFTRPMDLEQVKKILDNGFEHENDKQCFEFNKAIISEGSGRFLLFCEIKGNQVVSSKEETPNHESIQVDENTCSTLSHDNIRALYLIELSN